MGVLANESWVDTNGSAWSSDRWTDIVYASGYGGIVDIQSNQGHMSAGTSTFYGGYARALYLDRVSPDFDARVDVKISTVVECYTSFSFRASGAWISGTSHSQTDCFYLEIQQSFGAIKLFKRVAGAATTLYTASSLTINSGDIVSFHVRCKGHLIQVKYWIGGNEPADWSYQTNEETFSHQRRIAVSQLDGGGFSAPDVYWTNLVVKDLGSSVAFGRR